MTHIKGEPTPGLSYSPNNPVYWEAAGLKQELERVFEICQPNCADGRGSCVGSAGRMMSVCAMAFTPSSCSTSICPSGPCRFSLHPPLMLVLDAGEKYGQYLDHVLGDRYRLLIARTSHQAAMLADQPIGPADVGFGAHDVLPQTHEDCPNVSCA